MKKTLLLFIAMLSIALMNAQVVDDLFTVDNINYKVTAVGTPNEVEIQTSPGFTGALLIPAIVNDGANDFNVTSSVAAAFADNANITSLVVEGDTAIGLQAFRNNTNLESVDISNVTASLGNSAFLNCSSLVSVDVSALTSGNTGQNTFKGCTSLTTVNLSNLAGLIHNNAFENCTSLVNIDLNSATSIGNNVFKSCSALTTIDLSNTLTIGSQVFKDAGLTSIDLPVATSIGGLAFWNCASMTTINMPVVETILANAFNGAGLTSVTLPASLTSLPGVNTFKNCNELVQVTVLFETPLVLEETTENIFTYPIAAGANLTVPAGTKSAFENANVWQDFNTIDEAPTLSIDSHEAELGFSFYPNPANNFVSIKNSQLKNAAFTVYDLNGRALLNKTINSTQSEKINISNLHSGIYLFKVTTDTGAFVKRIIKQ